MDIFKLSRLALIISFELATLSASQMAHARDFFNPALLELGAPEQPAADLTVFENGGSAQAPGKYRVDVYLNGEMLEARDVDFKLQQDAKGEQSLQACVTTGDLEAMGVRVSLFPGLALVKPGECVNISELIPQASTTFNFNQQKLDISIPQAALSQQAKGYVSPDKWDQGINALLVNYSFSGANDTARNNDGQDSSTYYLNLQTGLNIGAWRVRNYSTWSRDEKGESDWESINSYIQRDIASLKSQLTMGDTTSPSEVFDSVPFRGVQLASDDEMLPESLRGFAPVVRGIAKSNAQVTIKQNGYVIYQSYVPPGAFEITDLFPTAGSGDLNVTIKEADGSEQNIVVPFASVPVLQREGRLKYSITGGQYRSYDDNVENTNFAQLTGIYGLPWGATVYGGVQVANQYQAASLGWGQNLGRVGAISADVTQAWSDLNGEGQTKGQSWRVRYGKSFAESGTNFSLASYRYSTKGFYTLQEALDTYTDDDRVAPVEHKKSRAEFTMSQNLWKGAGSLSVSMYKEGYWNDDRKTQSVSLGYNNNWENISYGVNYTYNKNGMDSRGNRVNEKDHVIALNVSISLDKWLPGSYATYSMNSGSNQRTTHNVGLNGTALRDNNLSYGISQGFSSDGSDTAGNVTADYRGGLGQVNVGYGYDKQQRRLNYGVQGGLVVHENGLTLSQPLGETIALVRAPGASDVNVTNETGITTDWRGYAVVPYLTPYRRNVVALDTQTLPDDVDMESNSQNMVPTRGAVVRADFKPNVGLRVLMTLLQANGQAVPFGATASVMASEKVNTGFVGDAGQVYLTGLLPQGKLQVKWGEAATQQCQVSYSLAENMANAGIQTVNAECR